MIIGYDWYVYPLWLYTYDGKWIAWLFIVYGRLCPKLESRFWLIDDLKLSSSILSYFHMGIRYMYIYQNKILKSVSQIKQRNTKLVLKVCYS